MSDELLTIGEREVLGCPHSARRREQGGRVTAAGYGLHNLPSTGSAADRPSTCTLAAWHTPPPEEIHDETISDSRAEPHEAGFASGVSYHV